jgi:hypothetical protein
MTAAGRSAVQPVKEPGGGELSMVAVVVAVMVTLLVYWVAEEYAEVLGEQAEGGRLPTWANIREMLAVTWPKVSASYLPLLALALTRLAGASALAAANVGLVVAIMLLPIHGWSAGRAARLAGPDPPALAPATSPAAGDAPPGHRRHASGNADDSGDRRDSSGSAGTPLDAGSPAQAGTHGPGPAGRWLHRHIRAGLLRLR